MQTKMREEFAKIFGEGREPEFYFAPGRVNLIGEHTEERTTAARCVFTP